VARTSVETRDALLIGAGDVYVVVWSDDHDCDVKLLSAIAARPPSATLTYDGLAITVVDRFLVTSGPPAARARNRNWTAAIAVSDLKQAQQRLEANGAHVVVPAQPGCTGEFLFARLPGGQVHEYVQWWPTTEG
jgi:hypothetical protein